MIVIPQHHNGPPESAHGGIAAGRFAGLVDPYGASVRFHSPIPMNTTLIPRTSTKPGAVEVISGSTLIATVTPLATRLEAAPVSLVPEIALQAARQEWLSGPFSDHRFPTCFGCGHDRPADSGLKLQPGQNPKTGDYVTTWSPNTPTDVEPWLVWAVLDCPSGAPALAAVGPNQSVLTGTISVSIHEQIRGDADYQIISRLADRQGRKLTTEAVLTQADGQIVAVCNAVWISVERRVEEKAA